MSRGLIGKKLGMTGIFTAEGKYVPVTVLQVGPCVVTQIKKKATDGYDALQLGFGEKKKSHVNRPEEGHLRKSGGRSFAFLREFAVENPDEYELGQEIPLDMFRIGQRVDVVGTTKGRGFAGVIKRYGFHRGPKSHGSHSIREPGSVGCSAWPAKVIKGKKMPGRYGHARQTTKNLEIVDIRPQQNLLMIKGAVPGHRSGVVLIQQPKSVKP